MNKKNLILITGNFPYSRKETFLESEIVELSKIFNRVVILPSDISGNLRETPDNVIIDKSYSKLIQSKFRKQRAIFSYYFLLGLISHFRLLLNIVTIKRLLSFTADIIDTKKWLNENCKWKDIVIYTYWLNGKSHGAAVYAKNKPGIKVIARAHRYDLYEYWFDPPFWPLRKNTLNIINKVSLISKDGLDYLKKKYPLFSNKYELQRLGVYNPKNITKKSNDNIIRVISVSNLTSVKRVDKLSEILKKFCKENADIKIEWTHFGDGPQMKKIKAFLSNFNYDNFSYSLKGQVSNKEIFDHYRRFRVDIFINISDSEGLPVSMMEAIANAVPIIATNVGGVSEIVTKETGILLKKEFTYEEFENALLCVYNDKIPPQTQILKFWQNNYDAERNYHYFANYLFDMAN